MKDSDKLITLVIHTPQRAERLNQVLKAHAINAVLEEVDVDTLKSGSRPLKVMVSKDKLMLALKLLESGDLVSAPLALGSMTGVGRSLLIPVDFSAASNIAVKVGCFLASKFNVEPVVLHSYVPPQFSPANIYDDQLDPTEMPDLADVGEDLMIHNAEASRLSKFKRQIEASQKVGDVVDIKFSTSLLEGIPEQVIIDYCRSNNPILVVMATRGKDKKESDLVGSVTAEVIDSCRVPVLAIPDNYLPVGAENIRRVAMLCCFTTLDFVAVRGLMRTFDYPATDIYLMPADGSSSPGVQRKLENLRKYFGDVYPTASFHVSTLDTKHFDDSMSHLLDQHHIQLIIVPNKKSNALSRFFHPTLAHKILFERDIPLLVLPV